MVNLESYNVGVRGSNFGMEIFPRDTNCRERFTAWVRTIPRGSMREESLDPSCDKQRRRVTVVGRGKKSLLSHPVSELRLGREKEKKEVRRYN